jgi:hypothetical protein
LPLVRQLLLCLVVSLISLTVLAAPAVTFSGNTVHVTGITPHGQVAVMSVMREVTGQLVSRMSRTEQLLTDAGAGVVDFDLGRTVPLRSIWTVVDLASGQYVIATPPGMQRLELPFATSIVKNTPSADADDEIAETHFTLDMLWVRPGNGGGAWTARVADGGSTDQDDANNGSTKNSTSQFRPLGAPDVAPNKPPKKFKTGDVLVMLDPFELNFHATQVTK